jgi:hypothetical protein
MAPAPVVALRRCGHVRDEGTSAPTWLGLQLAPSGECCWLSAPAAAVASLMQAWLLRAPKEPKVFAIARVRTQ